MTEADWLTSTDPQAMLESLHGKASERKLRLFACAACRRIWHLLADERSRRAVEVAERYADGKATMEERDAARAAAWAAAWDAAWVAARDAAWAAAWDAAWVAARDAAWDAARDAAWVAARAAAWVAARDAAWVVQCDLLRYIFGNPFRPVLLPYRCRECGNPCGTPAAGYYCVRCGCDEAYCPSLTWNDGTVPRLAQAIYDERAFDRLPILADALEEAGVPAEVECPECEGHVVVPPDRCSFGTGRIPHPLLAHLRSPGPHVRGCWSLDVILGME
jgi:hypothetical protein